MSRAELRLIPKLRFPEFHQAAPWSEDALGEAGHFVASLVGKKAEHFGKGKSRYITYMNVFSNTFTDVNSLGSVEIGPGEKQNAVRKGDVFFTVSSETSEEAGMSSVLLHELQDCYLNSFCTIFRFNDDRAPDHKFIGYYFRSGFVRDYFARNAQGYIRANLSKEVFNRVPVLSCALAEQQKIAKCLSTLDQLIEAESERLEALKAHEKGLMQQLFPRDGETLPRLRFPEFQDAPGWSEKRLEDLAKRGSGHTPSKAHPEYYNGGIKWVSLADSRRLDNGLILETKNQISEQGIQNSSAVLHPAGSVLVSRDAGVGKSAVMGSDMAVSQHFIVWSCDSAQLSNWFLYYLLQKMKPVFERAATGSTIKTIGLQFFVDLRVTIPSLPEQQRIATCLSSLDDLISGQCVRLNALQMHKEGLMQQLFPFSEETAS